MHLFRYVVELLCSYANDVGMFLFQGGVAHCPIVLVMFPFLSANGNCILCASIAYFALLTFISADVFLTGFFWHAGQVNGSFVLSLLRSLAPTLFKLLSNPQTLQFNTAPPPQSHRGDELKRVFQKSQHENIIFWPTEKRISPRM